MTLFGKLFESAGAGSDAEAKDATQLIPTNDVVTGNAFSGNPYTLNDLSLANWSTIALDVDYHASYEEIVRSQLWVRIAVNKMAYAIGRLPLKTYHRISDGQRERVSDSALAQLLRRPNESKETGHAAGFKARIAYDLLTYGNSIIVKAQTRPDRPPSQLIPYTPRGWMIDNGEYVYQPRNGAGPFRFPSWQIIHIIEPGPTLNGFGVSRLEAARLTLAIEYAAQKLGVASFQNGARPGGIINVKDLAKGKEAVERFKDEVRTRFGGVSKTGLPAVLQGDVTWTPTSWNLDESAVVAHRELTRIEVAALYDIPQPAMGILENANFRSLDQLHLAFYQDSLGWPISLIEECFEQQLINGVPDYDGQFLEFDMAGLMRGSYLERMQGYQIAINSGIKTRDEVRALENDPPMADQQPEAGLLTFPLNYGVSPEPAGKPGP